LYELQPEFFIQTAGKKARKKAVRQPAKKSKKKSRFFQLTGLKNP